MEIYLGALACTLGLSAGQILFKLSATRLTASQTVFDPAFVTTLFFALALYGTVSVAWVLLLRGAELSKLYPVMALSFAFVPIASALFFGENLNLQYGIGVVLIILGVALASSAGAQAK